jgi:opacity protein-like surface antigen
MPSARCISRVLAAIVIMSAGTLATPAAAQQPETPGWQFTFIPYVWASAFQGRIGVGPAVTDVDLSFGDIIDHADFALMGVFEARKERWIALVDGFYVGLSADTTASIPTGTTLRLDQDQVMVQPAVGYTLLVRPWGGLDALGGIRYWHVSTTLSATGVGQATRSASKGWVDGAVGARLRYSPGPRWHLFALGDVGAGGSDLTWQASGGVGFDVASCCTILAGYRHLDVDYESDGFVNDTYMSGPDLGFGFRF